MENTSKLSPDYLGFEQGPIRPPSESNSLLVRVTRNCPWNQCTFCPIYKGKKFSKRPFDHVKNDIDLVHKYIEKITKISSESQSDIQSEINRLLQNIDAKELPAFYAAFNWFYNGGTNSVFIQDANSFVLKPDNFIEILKYIKKRFPNVKRITSYARSKTIARMEDEDLESIREAGLNRIHIGLESGSDKVLKMIKKGATKAIHIQAGIKVKKAGIELSEYYMPGLGGEELSKEHALETADALNQINPDFIRLRTLGIPNSAPLFEDWQTGRFQKCTELMIINEILLFIENLNEITSTIMSDHILNLLSEVEGKLPEEKDKLIKVLSDFLAMDLKHQSLFQIGRRSGILNYLSDMNNDFKMARVKKTYEDLGIVPENVDEIIDEVMKRFI